jgi:hypothetical protein
MARTRWATFSVADHLDLRALVPDVLLFDRLAFPCPIDDKERQRWFDRKWDPPLLEYCLTKLEDLAVPFEWGEERRREFRTNMDQAQLIDQLTLSPLQLVRNTDDKQMWERSKQQTRMVLVDHVRRLRGDDVQVIPAYRSPDALLKDMDAGIAPANRQSRREALALLVGQKMMAPYDADPKVALGLAIDLAKDAEFQKRRRDLYDWQEAVIGREQTSRDDARQLADLISDLNVLVAKAAADRREQWIFFALKRVMGLSEMLHNPLSLGPVALETVEFLRRDGGNPAVGAMAAFHHVRERVIGPSVR